MFWNRPGVVAGLEARGRAVITPERLRRPVGMPRWTPGPGQAGLVGHGVEPAIVDALLAGETLRGVTDGENRGAG